MKGSNTNWTNTLSKYVLPLSESGNVQRNHLTVQFMKCIFHPTSPMWLISVHLAIFSGKLWHKQVNFKARLRTARFQTSEPVNCIFCYYLCKLRDRLCKLGGGLLTHVTQFLASSIITAVGNGPQIEILKLYSPSLTLHHLLCKKSYGHSVWFCLISGFGCL